MGKVKADDSDRVGGIAGHLQQYCLIKDCLNAGSYEGDSGKNGGIVGRGDSRYEIDRCLSVGSGWGDPMDHSSGDFPDKSGLYYYDVLYPSLDDNNFNHMKALSVEELKNPESYEDWDINGTASVWHVTESTGYFPVPYHSEMEEAIEEEN